MKQIILKVTYLFILLLTPSFFTLGNVNDNYQTDLLYYVAPDSKGSGTGLTEANAADFLNDSFWSLIKSQLTTKSIKIQFLDGKYLRAYTVKALNLASIGNSTHKLILSGTPNVVFNAPSNLNLATKSNLINIASSQNITIENIHFTGNGKLNYVLQIRYQSTKNILVDNCSWIDMRGVVYGATGCHNGANNVTYKNCTFKRIGATSGAHMIYNAYDPSRIFVFDCLFEDCPGDYVRFRDNANQCIVANSTFRRNFIISYLEKGGFIAMPVFNDVNPGDEFFATNYSFYNNQFINNSALTPVDNAFTFYSSGYTPPNYEYLLTKAEGTQLTSGTDAEKIKILKSNFGIDVAKIRLFNNTFTGSIKNKFSITSVANYGSVSKGWTGTANTESLIPISETPFTWEPTFASSTNNTKYDRSMIFEKVYSTPHYLGIEVAPEMIGKMFKIYDIHGRLIVHREIRESTIAEEVNHFTKGVYILSVENYTYKIMLN